MMVAISGVATLNVVAVPASSANSDKIDMSIASEYDAKINTDLQNAVQDYCNGVTASEDDCLNAFLDAIAADVTDITVE